MHRDLRPYTTIWAGGLLVIITRGY